jgi:hypothetical protein
MQRQQAAAAAAAGPIPSWLGKCFPGIEELDLSNNRVRRVKGTVLAWLQPSVEEDSTCLVTCQALKGTALA